MGNVKKNADQYRLTLEEACEQVHEPELRNELYEAYDACSISYERLSGSEMVNAVERQIHLAS